MTDKESLDAEAALGRVKDTGAAFAGMPFLMVLERALAAIEQRRPDLAMAAIEAIRGKLVAWPPLEGDATAEARGIQEEQIDTLLDQLEAMARYPLAPLSEHDI